MRPVTLSSTWCLVAALLATACNTQRPSDFAPVCPSYQTDIAPLLEQRCGQCHGPDTDAGYRVDSYLQALRSSDLDVPRVVAGDPASRVLLAARGELPPHTAVASDQQALLETWIVACLAAPDPTRYHPTGWGSPATRANPEDPAYHGAALRDAGYVTIACQVCHGQDLRGGKARVDCTGCHAQGPFACTTCHGDETSAAPPKALNGSHRTTTRGVGAHRQHVLDTPLHRAYRCEACHPAVANAEDEGHYRFGQTFVSDRPVVRLASVADGGTATWDPGAATCASTTCHAPNPLDVAASHTTPTWTTVTGQEARCGSCHGLGPTGHLSSRCEGCHGAAYADGGVDPVRHADGRIDFGPGTDCNVCHAGPGTLPFRDTHGDQDPAHLTVGAHTAHLAAGHLRGPMGCPDCHLQPATVFAPGHLTPLPASVFPPGWSGLAALSGTGPAFDRTAATCSNVYCHGNSQYLLAHDATAGLTRTPSWIGGTSAQTRCGACHGLPPADGTDYHLAGTGVGDCVRCHALTVLGDGGIRFFPTASGGVRSFHIDGLVNGNN